MGSSAGSDKVIAFELKVGDRILGRAHQNKGSVYEVTEVREMSGRDVNLTLLAPDGSLHRVALDMWSGLPRATVLDEMAQ